MSTTEPSPNADYREIANQLATVLQSLAEEPSLADWARRARDHLDRLCEMADELSLERIPES